MVDHRSRILSLLTISLLIFGSFFSNSSAIAKPQDSPTHSTNNNPANEVDGGGLLTIPYYQTPPTIDGICSEYAGAVAETFIDGNGQTSTVYLMHNLDYLYVCISAQPGSNPERFASLYLDPNGDGSNYIFAQQNDMAFHTSTTGALTSLRGSGVANGYQPDPSLDQYIQTAADLSNGDGFEYRLDLHGLEFGYNCNLFGIATYHHQFSVMGDDYGWPSSQWFDQPRTWQLAQLGDIRCDSLPNGQIAYIYRLNSADATSYYNLLVGAGYSVSLIPLADILQTDFSIFKLVLIADDTGSLDSWGTNGFTEAQVAKITSADKPIIGLGEGGYAFYGRMGLFIGWPHGWHGPQNLIKKSGGTLDPTFFAGIPAPIDPVQTYQNVTNSVGIYLTPSYPSDVIPIGLEVPTSDHAPLIKQGCRLLWGNSGNPYGMTDYGRTIFLNGINYMGNFSCATPPPIACLLIVKQADPPNNSTVTPGQVIHYSVSITFINDTRCSVYTATLIDAAPSGSTFIPGSGSDGISPIADGSLVWNISYSPTPVTKEFSVVVDNSACSTGFIENTATIQAANIDPYLSNYLSHKVQCQPIELPHQQPDYAEEEISIDPYPLILGHPSIVRVRISNFTSSEQPVNVAFQTSSDHFGIGLSYTTFDNKAVIIPANGNIIVAGTLIPAASGQWSIQIVVTGPGLATPLVTQSNLDVTEDLQPGVPDSLTFMVGNPTADNADIQLVVENTCSGWNAAITNPADGILHNMAPNEVREASLEVIPPTPLVFGSGCHIDVQGWIGSALIGGIRKLDIPPVHLPRDYQPAWEEPEITFNPNPPVVGSPNQYCIQLQNPLAVAISVNLNYSIADFGAGIDFTPVGSQAVVLPPNSIDKYCIIWTPEVGGTLHRCAMVTLHQEGYLDETSQRNVELVNTLPGGLEQLDIPFMVKNPDLLTHALTVEPKIFGLDPFWHVQILPDPPVDLMPGQTMMFHLTFSGDGGGLLPTTPLARFGDSAQVEISILLDGKQVGGFTVELAASINYLPMIAR